MTQKQGIDRTIAFYAQLKQKADLAVDARERWKKKYLVPQARKHGYKKGRSLLLVGSHNSVLIARDFDVVIGNQELAAKLPVRLRRVFLLTVFKPAAELKLLAQNSASLASREMRRFLKNAVQVKRHWRVARLDVRSSK